MQFESKKSTRIGLGMILLSLLLTVVWQPAGAQDEPKGLDTMIPTIGVSNIDIREVLILLSQYSGLNFTTAKEVKGGVTIELSNVTVRDVLEAVLKDNGFYYQETPGGIIRVMTLEQYKKETEGPALVDNRRYIPRYVAVEDLEKAFRSLLSKNGKMTVVKQTNTLIVEDVPEALAKIEQYYPLIDVQLLTRVFRLEYVDVDQVQKQIEALIDVKKGQVLVDKERNILIVTTTRENLEKIAKVIEEFDMKLEMEVFEIQFNDPDEVAKLVKPLLSKEGYLEIHEQTSSIIIRDIPSRVDAARELIASIDRPPKAVWIEAEIVSVNLSKEFDLGANWRFGKYAAPFSATTEGVLTDAGNNMYEKAFTSLMNGQLNFFDFGQVGNNNLAVAINAIEKNNFGNLLSSPRVLVVNDEEADLNVGSEEPFSVRQRQIGTNNNDSDIYTQRSRRVGITLTVTPHIIPAGYVKMDIYMEDSNADRVDLGNDNQGLRVNQRTLDTMVLVKDGRTVGLGGLISRNKSNNRTGVPFLSQIPVLGAPFRNTSKTDSRTKLLLFVTPRIVDVDDPYQKFQIDDSLKYRMLEKDGIWDWQDKNKDEKDKDNPDAWIHKLPKEEREIYQPDSEKSKEPILMPGDYDQRGIFWTPGKNPGSGPVQEQPVKFDQDEPIAPNEDVS